MRPEGEGFLTQYARERDRIAGCAFLLWLRSSARVRE